MQITNQSIFAKLGASFAVKLESGLQDEQVSFFAHFKQPLTDEQIKQLTDVGCDLPSDAVSKKLTTASAKLGNISHIAALDFIKLLNLSQQLDPK